MAADPVDVSALAAMVPRPVSGRVFETSTSVRFGDAEPSGRLRLDAVARILQDTGNDDFVDAGLDPLSPWLARRATVAAECWPQLGEELRLATWCAGVGSRWAERRTSITGSRGGHLEAATLWVHVTREGRPAKLPDWFIATYAGAADGRTLSSRLHLPSPPENAEARPWALRATDLDAMAHVNNAAVWAPVEDEIAHRRVAPARATVEFPGALLASDDVVLRSAPSPDGFRLWLTVDDTVRVAADVVVEPTG
jgi:acyl-ACP thioesterase